MSDKKRFPGEVAAFYARSIMESLRPFCSRVEIAGSLRRQKLEVGDIEILYISKPGTRKVDLLATEDYGEAEKHLDWLLYKGELDFRLSKTGSKAWGQKNKLAIHVKSGIPVDFFATTEPNWWNALVVRTGGKDNNLAITTAAQRQGWSFEAYGSGFRKLDNSEHYPTHSERDVFKFVGLPFLPPEKRL